MPVRNLQFATHPEASLPLASDRMASTANHHRRESVFHGSQEISTLQSILRHLSTLPTSPSPKSVFDLPAQLICSKTNSTLPSISNLHSTSQLLISESSVRLHPSLISLRRFADGIAIDRVFFQSNRAVSHLLPLVDSDANDIAIPSNQEPKRHDSDPFDLSSTDQATPMRVDSSHQDAIQLHLSGCAVKSNLNLSGFEASASTRWQTVIELHRPKSTSNFISIEPSELAESKKLSAKITNTPLDSDLPTQGLAYHHPRHNDFLQRDNQVMAEFINLRDDVRQSMLAPYLYPKANTAIKRAMNGVSHELLSRHHDAICSIDDTTQLDGLRGITTPTILSNHSADNESIIASQTTHWVDLNFDAAKESILPAVAFLDSGRKAPLAKSKKAAPKTDHQDSKHQIQKHSGATSMGVAEVMHSRCNSFVESTYRRATARFRTQASFSGSAKHAIRCVTGPVLLGNHGQDHQPFLASERFSYETEWFQSGEPVRGEKPSSAERPEYLESIMLGSCGSLYAFASVFIPARLAKLFGWTDPLMISQNDGMFFIGEQEALACESVSAYHANGNLVATTQMIRSPQASAACIEMTATCMPVETKRTATAVHTSTSLTRKPRQKPTRVKHQPDLRQSTVQKKFNVGQQLARQQHSLHGKNGNWNLKKAG